MFTNEFKLTILGLIGGILFIGIVAVQVNQQKELRALEARPIVVVQPTATPTLLPTVSPTATPTATFKRVK